MECHAMNYGKFNFSTWTEGLGAFQDQILEIKDACEYWDRFNSEDVTELQWPSSWRKASGKQKKYTRAYNG